MVDTFGFDISNAFNYGEEVILPDGREYLVNDLVPVTNESGVPGMYDLVKEVFYKKPSTSTGDFSYG